MKRNLLFLVIFIPLYSIAQRSANVGVGSGIVNYIGDLGNEKNFPYSSMSPGVQITFRDFLNNPSYSGTLYKPLSMELRFSWHRLQYDETEPLHGKQGMELRNYLRGIGFRNDLFGAAVNFTYTFYQNQFIPLYKQGIAFYIMAGAGVYYGRPKADLFNGDIDISNRYYFWNDGTIHDVAQSSGKQGNIIEKDGVYETDLIDWRTEGQGINLEGSRNAVYSTTNIGIPMGGGVRYGLNRNITFSAEFNYYYFLTDYLDDVSGRYATYEELHAAFPDARQFELARYISDPTGRGTDGTLSPRTSPRGNPGLKDSFTFVSFEISYLLTIKPKEIYGQTVRR
jgi:hypothetical protein